MGPSSNPWPKRRGSLVPPGPGWGVACSTLGLGEIVPWSRVGCPLFPPALGRGFPCPAQAWGVGSLVPPRPGVGSVNSHHGSGWDMELPTMGQGETRDPPPQAGGATRDTPPQARSGTTKRDPHLPRGHKRPRTPKELKWLYSLVLGRGVPAALSLVPSAGRRPLGAEGFPVRQRGRSGATGDAAEAKGVPAK